MVHRYVPIEIPCVVSIVLWLFFFLYSLLLWENRLVIEFFRRCDLQCMITMNECDMNLMIFLWNVPMTRTDPINILLYNSKARNAKQKKNKKKWCGKMRLIDFLVGATLVNRQNDQTNALWAMRHHHVQCTDRQTNGLNRLIISFYCAYDLVVGLFIDSYKNP